MMSLVRQNSQLGDKSKMLERRINEDVENKLRIDNDTLHQENLMLKDQMHHLTQ